MHFVREEIIGHFGEGMKLGALAILRSKKNWYLNKSNDDDQNEKKNIEKDMQYDKTVIIDTNKERWLFMLEKDENYNKKICLFIKIVSLSEKKSKKLNIRDKFTYTRIGGVSVHEWNLQYKNFLFLLKTSEMVPIDTYTQNSKGTKYKANILLEESMKGKLFVKELHVNNYKETDLTYGYNINDIEINRDRMYCFYLYILYLYII